MTNYTVILSDRRRFGNNNADDESFKNIPFGGAEANIPFQCRGVALDQPAIMLFEHAAQTSCTMMINGREIPNGSPSTESSSTRTVNNNDRPDSRVTTVTTKWIQKHMILDAGLLRDDNVLRIFQTQGSNNRPLERFGLGDIAVFFKISTGTVGPRDAILNPEILR